MSMPNERSESTCEVDQRKISNNSTAEGKKKEGFLARPCKPLFDSSGSGALGSSNLTWEIVNLSATGRYPSGLSDISFRFKGLKEDATGRLYFRCGESFSERDFVWFRIDHQGVVKFSADLPAAACGYAVVVFGAPPEIEIKSVAIKEVGGLRRLAPRAYDLVRYHIKHPSVVVSKLRRALIILRKGGVSALRAKLARREDYIEWVINYDTLSASDLASIRKEMNGFAYKPLISILLPVFNTPECYLIKAIESVRTQIYDNWQLCIADDNSTDPRVRGVIEEYVRQDLRIKFIAMSENGHISKTTNAAATLAGGEFYGFLDHDDELREHALFMVVRELNRYPKADLIYSDEDKINDAGVRFDPYFKSSWNPELILAHNFICHFTVVRAELFKKLGGLRPEVNGAQDWDLALRLSENTTPDRIRHIPAVLYHWRAIEGSTAQSTSAKPYVTQAQIRAVSEHLGRRGDQGASVELIPALSMLRVRYALPEPRPLVSVVIPTHNQIRLLAQCVNGLLNNTAYQNLEILIVDNRSDDSATLSYLRDIQVREPRVKVLRDEGAFNFSRINNEAVQHTTGSLICFMNNDIEVIHPDWLDEMVSHAVRPDVGAVGARLLFPDRSVQHAGVITGIGGVAGHAFKGIQSSAYGYYCKAILQQNVSAVTAACMLLRRETFDQVGGFDQERLAVAFNDIDLCLKIHATGKLIVYTPYAELIHHESVSRGYEDTPDKLARFNREYNHMKSRWGSRLSEDPYYNPNFLLEGVGYALGDRRSLVLQRP